LPAHKPFDLMWGESKRGVQLYIRRVFIMDDWEAMLPAYLRFVRGVVDSPDLPLNVSREMLQQSAPLEKIKVNLVTKVLRTLGEMHKDEHDTYLGFYKELGSFLKEGVYQDRLNREQLASLLLFESTRVELGKVTSLEQYIERMQPEQKEIFYLIGDNREVLETSPHLEGFKARDLEVLLLTDPVDEFVVQALTEYRSKKLKAVDKGEVDASAIDEQKKKQLQPLLDFMKQKIDEVKEVRLSSRLKDSAVCLVLDEWAMGAHMERLLQRMGRGNEVPGTKRILEVNPDHPAIAAMQALHARNAQDERLAKYCRLLYDEAIIAEGSRVKEPATLARLINELVVKDARA
jgi:molecular chaperone HtpG